MKKQEPEQTANSTTSQPHIPRRKVAIYFGGLLVVALLVALALCIRHESKAERRLRALGELREQPYGPVWYRNLARRRKLPVPTRPADFSSSKITDDDMPHLSKLPSLYRVALYRAPITDAGLAHLHGFKKLTNLTLIDVQITNNALPHIGRLTSLRQLLLTGANITDAGLVHLRPLKKLQSLNLVRTQITDEGLPLLQGFADLRYLYLNETNVTNDGLAHLKSMKSLERIWLDKTKFSPSAVADLKEALPDLDIVQLQTPPEDTTAR